MQIAAAGMRKWHIAVHYNSKLGNIDVDYLIDDLAHLDLLIRQGPGYACIRYIEVRRNELVYPLLTMEEVEAERRAQAAAEGDEDA